MSNYGTCRGCGYSKMIDEDDYCESCNKESTNTLLYVYLHDMDEYIRRTKEK